MSCNVISGRFKTNARANKSYVVENIEHNKDGYILLSLKISGDKKYRLSAAVLKHQYPDIDLKIGDVVKVACSSRIVTPTSKFSPHIILSKIEKISGDVVHNDIFKQKRRLVR